MLARDPPYVDATGYVTASDDSLFAYLGPSQRDGARQQIDVVRAKHQVSSEFHEKTLAFFERFI